MAELVAFRTMATYIAGGTDRWIGGKREEWVSRGEVLELVSGLIGLAKHTCLLAWKDPARMTPNMYHRLVCWYACARFEHDRDVRMRAMRGEPFQETIEWEILDGKPVGVSCIMDNCVHFTLLFVRYEREMRARGRDADCFRALGGVGKTVLGESSAV